jgi:hypothetical protein
MMQPYVDESKLTLTIGLYNNPKRYADQESPIGETIGASQVEGFREAQVGSAQAWYYHTDKTIVLWECFFDRRFHKHPFVTDTNMQQLWQAFEHYLVQKFPQASTLATPFRGFLPNPPMGYTPERLRARRTEESPAWTKSKRPHVTEIASIYTV